MKNTQSSDTDAVKKPTKSRLGRNARNEARISVVSDTSTRATIAAKVGRVARIEKDAAARSADGMSFEESELQQMIRQEAYFRAERRGFIAGNEWQDWFEAEQEIYRQLKRQLPKH